MWDKKFIDNLTARRNQSYEAGGENRVQKQHMAGKLTARERLELLFDEGTFVEIGTLVESRITEFGLKEKWVPGDGVVTGYGTIDGRVAYASSEDFTVMGGTLGEYHSKKICNIMDMALNARAPYISINDSGGARIEEGISSLDGYSGIFYRNTKASGVIPQIAVILGPCAGGACYSPALCDFIFMCNINSRMFITGPGVVKTVLGENVTPEDLGSAAVHTKKSGVAHFSFPSEKECLAGVRKLLSYLPQNNHSEVPRIIGKSRDCSYRLQEIVPDNQRHTYDVHQVIETFLDEGTFLEIQKDFGKSIVIGLGRIDTEVLGIVASQPSYMGGSLDIDASEKAARFVRFCDCFNIPILTLVDVPGFLPGTKQEWGGIIRRGAKLLYAYSEATVPKITLIMRKAYGGAYIAMNSRGMGADVVYAWPIAQIAVMGAEGAVDIIYKKQLKEAEGPKGLKEKFVSEYNDNFVSPYIAAARGYIDEVIYPEETRGKIRTALEVLKTKEQAFPSKKHGNIPL